jgi:hypothetical protein
MPLCFAAAAAVAAAAPLSLQIDTSVTNTSASLQQAHPLPKGCSGEDELCPINNCLQLMSRDDQRFLVTPLVRRAMALDCGLVCMVL